MAEKLLSESEWKKFAKGHEFKDAALVKAMAAAEKGAKLPPGEQAPLFQELARQAEKLGDANSKDKTVAKYIADVVAAAKGEVARLEKEAKAADKKTDEADSEDEDSPALITSGLVALLRQVRKGVPLQAMVVLIGKRAGVMLSRRPITPSRRKLLVDYLDEKGTAKAATGTCIFEENAVTFVLATQAAGMARKLKAALLEQTGLRMKVRVRGEDPNDIDEEAEDDEGGAAGTAAAQATAPAPEGATETAAEDPRKARFEARLRELGPSLTAALKDPQRSDLTRLRGVSGFAMEKSHAGDWAAAQQALDMLAKLLEASPAAKAAAATPSATTAPTPGTATGDVNPATAFTARLAALVPRVKDAIAAGTGEEAKARVAEAGARAKQRDFEGAHALLDAVEALLAPAARPAATIVQMQQSRLAWDTQRKSVQTQLQALERELRAAVLAHNADEASEDEFDDGDLAEGIARLHALLDHLDERLIDKLDEALNAEGARRLALQREAAAIVREYQAFVESDPLMADIDDNGFTPVSIRADTLRTLARLAQQL